MESEFKHEYIDKGLIIYCHEIVLVLRFAQFKILQDHYPVSNIIYYDM